MSATETDQDAFATAHAAGARVVDVREPHEYEAGHVPGSVNIPLGELPGRIGEVAGPGPVYVVCLSGARSVKGAQTVDRSGTDAISVAGGTKAWIDAGRPVTTGPTP